MSIFISELLEIMTVRYNDNNHFYKLSECKQELQHSSCKNFAIDRL